jgi:putative nucleotidyltransferase with HDIG domain
LEVNLKGASAGSAALRLVLLVAGCTVIGAVALYMGLGRTEALVISVLGGILAVLATELPWGGFLFPADALLIGLCLLTGRSEVAIAGIGVAVASGITAARWGRATAVACVRNVVAALVATAMWRVFIPSWVVTIEGQGVHSVRLAGSDIGDWAMSGKAVPAILLCSLGYLVAASAVETLLRRFRQYAFGEFWLLNFGRNLHHLLFTVVLGAIISVAYRDVGAVAFVLFAFPIALTRDALKRSLDLRASRMEALKALSSSVDARDRYTYDHSNRVSRLAGMLAREMGFTEATVEMIEGGALLHDIGKLGVDAEILSKPGPLEPDERDVIRQHPLQSADVVSRLELLGDSVETVRYHHERPDGTGYPEGLSGHEIPVGARILNVADAFDAMISDRPYRRGKTVEQALEELKKGSGSEFDPVVVEYMTRLIAKRQEEIAEQAAA